MSRVFKIDDTNKTVNFTFDYDEGIIKQIKTLDRSHRWNPELKEWIVPVNDFSKSRILKFIADWNFKRVSVEEEDADSLSNECNNQQGRRSRKILLLRDSFYEPPFSTG